MATTCAIYTRKSTEEGLEQDFNSLHAQREACEAFIASQRSLGWKLLPKHYDDGGYSGGNMQRPALTQLLADIEVGRVQTVVVYKVDRLTRSLADFAKLVERFDAQGVSFVSVTQQFNTTTSMGRLTLNVLLSFAQFEREVTAERIRDKIAASKRKGMWMGGMAPIGYRAQDKQLVIDPPEAERVREIYRLYLELGCVRQLKATLDARQWRTPARPAQRNGARGCRPFTRGHLYRILSNPIYAGRVPHGRQSHEGRHEAIVDAASWQAVQAQMTGNVQGSRPEANTPDASWLAGKLFDAHGQRLVANQARKAGRRYRYYVAQLESEKPLRLPAAEVEQAVVQGLTTLLRDERRLGARVSAEQAQRDLSAARLALAQLEVEGSARDALVQAWVQRVSLGEDALAMDILVGGTGGTLHRVEVPFERRKVGLAVRLVLRADAPRQTSTDPKLVAQLLRAQRWFKRLMTDEEPSVAAIAADEGLTTSHVMRVLQLAFLAPDLTAKIARGEQPLALTIDRLLDCVPLPLEWAAQRAVLGFDAV